jgi:hypothetical protein
MKRTIVLLLLVSLAGCKPKEWAVNSAPVQEPVTIDGDAAEWSEELRFNDEATLGYAVRNDSENLYLCLRVDKSLFNQVMRGGLTVWFDPDAKTREILGIHYPMGMQDRVPGERMEPPDREEQGNWGQPGQRGSKQQGMDPRGMKMLGEMEILGPEKDDRNRASAQNNFGIQAAIGGVPEEPVYELKIPLQSGKGKPYAIETGAGAEISIGLITGKVEAMRRGGGPGGGGRGGRGGGMGRGGGGGMGPDGGMGGPPPGMEGDPSASTEPIKLWLRVRLAQ